MSGDFKYLSGFGNHFATEGLPGVLPLGQNAPQKVAYGLYAEQLSGSAFTVSRAENLRSWLYRIHPSVLHGNFERVKQHQIFTAPLHSSEESPEQKRWDPLPIPKKPTHFLEGLRTLVVNGDVKMRKGCAAHLYAINRSMEKEYLYNADGEFLFVPQQGNLILHTELGKIKIAPGEIAVIPRGIRFQVHVEGDSRGYIGENYGLPLRLPTLGVIGSNGLANPRDFLVPEASYEEKKGDFLLIAKYQGNLWQAPIKHSPLDVVGWHGNYAPYKYDLSLFNTINTVSFDHPDPSIFTVLTSPSELAGVANLDFVIFPPRWMVAEKTFRPPYYHRNIMSEFMGLIKGVYDAKPQGFVPGGSSLHNCMSGHGPDAETFAKASSSELKPQYYGNTLAFMFESSLPFAVTQWGENELLQKNYLECWSGLESHFRPK